MVLSCLHGHIYFEQFFVGEKAHYGFIATFDSIGLPNIAMKSVGRSKRPIRLLWWVNKPSECCGFLTIDYGHSAMSLFNDQAIAA